MKELITVAEAARAKQVKTSTIYAAIADGRLPALHVLGRHALRKADVQCYEPVRRAGVRPNGAPGRGGRPCGVPMSEEGKARISEGQKQRWALRKQASSTAESN